MTVDMDATIEEVGEVLRLHDLSAVPVIERSNGTVLGIISARDLAHFHYEKRNAETCTLGKSAHISRSRSILGRRSAMSPG